MNIVSLLYNKIQIVTLKKRLLGKNQQYQATVVIPQVEAKEFNLDRWAFHLKKALGLMPEKTVSGKIKLILGQQFWHYRRIELPADVTDNALSGYIKEQLVSKVGDQAQNGFYKYVVNDYKGKKYAGVYLLTQKTFSDLVTLFSFYDLKIEEAYPEAVLIFSLFGSTLNKQKEEAALFLEYEEEISTGLLFNSTGLLSEDLIVIESAALTKRLKELKKEQSLTIARLILGGKLSTQIRQDNFTKECGIWTNPLVKVLQNSSLKQLAIKLNLESKLLEYNREIALLNFIENKQQSAYSLDLKTAKSTPAPRPTPEPIPHSEPTPIAQPVAPLPTINPHPPRRLPKLPIKNLFKILLLILISSAITYALFNFGKWGLGAIKEIKIMPTPTPTTAPKPKATPTPKISRSDITVDILNGTGVAGMASSLQSELEDLEYQVTQIGNADNYDYEQTVVITKNQAMFKLISADLKKFNVTKPTFEQTNSDTTTIIFGADLVLP